MKREERVFQLREQFLFHFLGAVFISFPLTFPRSHSSLLFLQNCSIAAAEVIAFCHGENESVGVLSSIVVHSSSSFFFFWRVHFFNLSPYMDEETKLVNELYSLNEFL